MDDTANKAKRSHENKKRKIIGKKELRKNKSKITFFCPERF